MTMYSDMNMEYDHPDSASHSPVCSSTPGELRRSPDVTVVHFRHDPMTSKRDIEKNGLVAKTILGGFQQISCTESSICFKRGE